MAARVAATVVRMPPAEYGVPVIRAANSSARSPANTRCECESTNPGITARPPRSYAVSAAGALAGRAGPRDAARLDDEGGVAQRTRPVGGVVRGQLADPGQQQSGHRSHTFLITRSSSAPTS